MLRTTTVIYLSPVVTWILVCALVVLSFCLLSPVRSLRVAYIYIYIYMLRKSLWSTFVRLSSESWCVSLSFCHFWLLSPVRSLGGCGGAALLGVVRTPLLLCYACKFVLCLWSACGRRVVAVLCEVLTLWQQSYRCPRESPSQFYYL